MSFYQGLATVLLRVFAATVIVQWLGLTVSLSVSWMGAPPVQGGDAAPFYWAAISSYAVYSLLGFALWFLAAPIGRRLGAGFSAPAPNLAHSSEALVRIGSFLIGLYFLIEYSAKLVVTGAGILIKNAQLDDYERLYRSPGISDYEWSQLAQYSAIVIPALGLTLGVRGVAKLFSWLRTAGQYRGEGAAEKSAPGE